MVKKFFWSSFSILLVIILSIALSYIHFLRAPLLRHNSLPLTIKIPPGSAAIRIGYLFTQTHTVRYPTYWLWYMQVSAKRTCLQAGEYLITPDMTPHRVLNILASGKIVQHKIIFIEGWTFLELKQALKNEADLTTTMASLSDAQIMQKIGASETQPEGLFFPDTYLYVWGENDLTVLKKAYVRMQAVLQAEWQHRAEHLWYKKPYQALIVASMVEKETALPSERALIAGIILNRLHKQMPLQIDPTVMYGVHQSFTTPLTLADLHAKTPYNTYRYYGLPPTPICMPSLASIEAALHPAKTKFLYYVAKGDGSHAFAETYQQQKANVKRYILKTSATTI